MDVPKDVQRRFELHHHIQLYRARGVAGVALPAARRQFHLAMPFKHRLYLRLVQGPEAMPPVECQSGRWLTGGGPGWIGGEICEISFALNNST